jgi:lipopolysaccharide/colanic/teichoic acid biosynthesis glycosyltransferase
MSLVGPRPPIPYEVELYQARHLRRLAVKPGITGLWQVSGRSTTAFEEMVAMDLEYIRRRSFGLDLQILAKTIPAVFSARGAH